MEWWQEKTVPTSPDMITVSEGVNPTGVDLTLEVGGTISGHVYQPGGTVPVANTQIVVMDYNPSGSPWINRASATTDSQGYYKTPGLPPGQYVLAANTQNTYLTEWYENTFSAVQPSRSQLPFRTIPRTSIFILIFRLPSPVTFMTGLTGQPIPNATVTIIAPNLYWWGIIIPGLMEAILPPIVTAGSYWLYRSPGYVRRVWQDALGWQQAIPVATSSSTSPDYIDFNLEAGGTISGVVTSGNVNLANISVGASGINGTAGGGNAITNANGEYTIIGLSFGDYSVCASSQQGKGSNDFQYAREYYNDKTQYNPDPVSISQALPDVSGISFELVQSSTTTADFQTIYAYTPSGDTFINTEVTGNKNWNTGFSGSNVASGKCQSCTNSTLTFDWKNHAPSTAGPPNYLWSFGDLVKGKAADRRRSQ
jgi:hypothetical protein